MAEEHSQTQDNSRCFKHRAEDGPSLFQNGNLVFQAHHVGWIVATFFTLVAIAVSIWLVWKHLKWYTKKREQRHIVRILFMVPIYAIVSLCSYLFWNHATPLILLRDCYESTVLTSFFYLLLLYISPDPEEQRVIFRKVGISQEQERIALRNGEKPRRWAFPLGWVKKKPEDGMYFLQSMKWGVLQYCVLRPLTTLAAVVLDYIGLYCEASWSPGWGHIYLVLIVSISVSVSMYCLIQLYLVSSEYLSPQRPILKLFAIKAVVFLTFWQATFLSVLAMFGLVKNTKYMTAEDINIGIGAMLECFEMALFALLHLKAFTYKTYKARPEGPEDLPPIRMGPMRALGHAMDFRETFRELWAGCVYMWTKMRGREPKVDVGARRHGHYECAFEAVRPSHLVPPPPPFKKDKRPSGGDEKGEREVVFPSVRVDVDRTIDVGGRREWLGAGNHYGYGIFREKSEGLEEQFEQEMARRGYGRTELGKRGNIKPVDEGPGHVHDRSWWRSVYNRISQSGDHEQDDPRLSPPPSRLLRSSKKLSSRRSSRHKSRDDAERVLLDDNRHGIDDPPPPSLIKKYRSQGPGDFTSQVPPHHDQDILTPLSAYDDHRRISYQRQQRRITPPPAQPQWRSSPPVLSTSPPPQSLLLAPATQRMPSPRNIVFGHMFPSMELLSTQGHTDGGFMTSGPPSAEHGYGIGMAGQRNVPPLSIPTNSTPSMMGDAASDYRQTVSPPPLPRNNIERPTPSQTRPSRGLRRSSAVYTPQRPTHGYRQSLPGPAQLPPHTFMQQPSNRRRSPPVVLTVPAPLAPQQNEPATLTSPVSSGQYDQEVMDSTLAQPSVSGRLDDNKSPPATDELRGSGRYPGLLVHHVTRMSPSSNQNPSLERSNASLKHHFSTPPGPGSLNSNDNYNSRT